MQKNTQKEVLQAPLKKIYKSFGYEFVLIFKFGYVCLISSKFSILENKFKSSKFHKIIFTISLFIVLFIGAITYKHIEGVSTSSKLIMHTYEVNLELEQLFSYIKDSENSMRGFLITNEKTD